MSRVEVNDGEVRIMGSKDNLLRTLAAGSGAATATRGVPSFVPNWRRVANEFRTNALDFVAIVKHRINFTDSAVIQHLLVI